MHYACCTAKKHISVNEQDMLLPSSSMLWWIKVFCCISLSTHAHASVVVICLYIWGFWCPKQVSQTVISNCIPQYSMGWNYLSMPEIPASGAKVIIWLIIHGMIMGPVHWHLSPSQFKFKCHFTVKPWLAKILLQSLIWSHMHMFVAISSLKTELQKNWFSMLQEIMEKLLMKCNGCRPWLEQDSIYIKL